MSSYQPMNVPPVGSKSSSTATILILVLVIALGCMVVCGGVLAVLLIPAFDQGREAARRTQCANNMKQIALALHNYESAYKRLPPAYTVDENGNRLHSWRTLLLPYIEQNNLYQQIDLSKPWNDPANAILKTVSIPTYHCPSSTTSKEMTTYQIIDDPTSLFPGSKELAFAKVSDGLSNTLAVCETDDKDAVHWAEPKDQSLATYMNPVKGAHRGGRNAAFGDASVRFLSDETDATVRQGIATVAGGETVSIDR